MSDQDQVLEEVFRAGFAYARDWGSYHEPKGSDWIDLEQKAWEDYKQSIITTPLPASNDPIKRDVIAAAIANMPLGEFHEWVANATAYPNCYQSSVDATYAKTDRVLAAITTPSPASNEHAELIARWMKVDHYRSSIQGGVNKQLATDTINALQALSSASAQG